MGDFFKRCTQCKKMLELEHFYLTYHRERDAKYYKSECKVCFQKKTKALAKRKGYSKKRAQTTEYKDYMKEYYHKNIERFKEYRKRFLEKNPDYFRKKAAERKVLRGMVSAALRDVDIA